MTDERATRAVSEDGRERAESADGRYVARLRAIWGDDRAWYHANTLTMRDFWTVRGQFGVIGEIYRYNGVLSIGDRRFRTLRLAIKHLSEHPKYHYDLAGKPIAARKDGA